MKRLSLTVGAENAGRVDLIVRELSQTSRSQARGMIDRDCVSVNEVKCNSMAKLVSEGDVVSIQYDPNQRYREKKRAWEDRTFTIIHEDEHLIVVDKSAGSLTVPTDNGESNTLVDRLSLYLSHSRGKKEAWLVHRLDRLVSGLLVFGKHEALANVLIEQFKQQKPQRTYAAIVAGVLPNHIGTFESHLATGSNLDSYAAAPSHETEHAVTHYRVLRNMPDATHVEVTLDTGRRDQIRVHFADAGHPVLGDPRYKSKLATHPRWKTRRIALHAGTLGFINPITGESMTFESPIPSVMRKFVAGSR